MKILYQVLPVSWIHSGVAMLFLWFAFPAVAQSATPMVGPIVRQSVHHDVSPALRDLPTVKQSQLNAGAKQEAEPVRSIPLPPGLKAPWEPDSVVQSAAASPSPEFAATVGMNFDGIGQGVGGVNVTVA